MQLVSEALFGKASKDQRTVAQFEKEVGPLWPELAANVAWLKSVNNMLQRGIGLSLQHYDVGVPVAGCKVSKFYLADVELLGEKMRRLCYELTDGTRGLVITRAWREGREHLPVLHLHMDQGPVGWPSAMYSLCRLLCSVTPDIFHRLHNDMLLSVAQNGLLPLRRSFRSLLKMLRGGFSSDATLHGIRKTVRELREMHHAPSTFFELIGEPIIMELMPEMGPGPPAVEQESMAWQRFLENMGEHHLGP